MWSTRVTYWGAIRVKRLPGWSSGKISGYHQIIMSFFVFLFTLEAGFRGFVPSTRHRQSVTPIRLGFAASSLPVFRSSRDTVRHALLANTAANCPRVRRPIVEIARLSAALLCHVPATVVRGQPA